MTVKKATLSEFRAEFAEFNSVDDALVLRAVNIAFEISSVTKMALLYLCAHVLVLLQTEPMGEVIDGGSGEVMEETIGPKTARYKTQAKTERDVFFSRTSYGRMFLTLEKRSARYTVSTVVL